MNKSKVLENLHGSHQQILDAISGLSDQLIQQAGAEGEWSVKDILNHLSHWESELVTILWRIQAGQEPSVPSHTSAEIDSLNQQWYQEGLKRPLAMVIEDFKGVRKQTIRRVEGFSEEELTNPDRYPFMRGKPLAKKIAIYTFEHDLEHLDQIGDWKKRQGL